MRCGVCCWSLSGLVFMSELIRMPLDCLNVILIPYTFELLRNALHRAQRLFLFVRATLGINNGVYETLGIVAMLKITSEASSWHSWHMVESLLSVLWIKPLFTWGRWLELMFRNYQCGWVSCRLWWSMSSLSSWPNIHKRNRIADSISIAKWMESLTTEVVVVVMSPTHKYVINIPEPQQWFVLCWVMSLFLKILHGDVANNR
jgi:hypothetical protein